MTNPWKVRVHPDLTLELSCPQELARQLFLEVDGLPVDDGLTCDVNMASPAEVMTNVDPSAEDLVYVQEMTDVFVLDHGANWEFAAENQPLNVPPSTGAVVFRPDGYAPHLEAMKQLQAACAKANIEVSSTVAAVLRLAIRGGGALVQTGPAAAGTSVVAPVSANTVGSAQQAKFGRLQEQVGAVQSAAAIRERRRAELNGELAKEVESVAVLEKSAADATVGARSAATEAKRMSDLISAQEGRDRDAGQARDAVVRLEGKLEAA